MTATTMAVVTSCTVPKRWLSDDSIIYGPSYKRGCSEHVKMVSKNLARDLQTSLKR